MEEHLESNNFMPDHKDASNDSKVFETVDNLKEDDIDQENYENFGKESPGQSQSPKSLSNINEDRNTCDDSTVPHSPAYSPPLDVNGEYAEEDGMDEVEGMLEDDGEKHEGVYATNEDGIDENGAGNGEDDGDAHMDEDEGIDVDELSKHKSPNKKDQNINESKSSVYHSASPRSPSQSDVNDCADDRNDDNRPQQSTSEFMFAPINDNLQHTYYSWHDENDPGGDQKISVTEFKVEEVDPLMQAEQDSADTHAEIESSLDNMLGKSSGRAAVNSHNGSEFNMVTAESVGLASEFISIEHLDKSNVFRCEVCGERCNTSYSLESHHSQLGHYKCYNASCGSVFCGTAQELATPQETAHADYTYEQNSGSVQQLVQQVLGLPTPPQENSQQNSLSQVSITSLPQVSISPLPSGQVSISPISLPQVSFSPAQQQPHVPSIWLRPINSLMNPKPNSNQSSIIHLSHYANIGKESPGQSQSPKSLSNVNEDRNSVDDSTVPHRPAYSLPLDDNEEYAEEDGMDEVEGMLEDDGEKHEGVYATNEDGIDENDAGNGEDDGDAHMDEDEGIDDEELSEHKSPNEEDQNINESKSSVYHSASPRSPSQSDVNDCADDRNDDNRLQQSTSEFMFAPINETSQHTKFSLHDENDPAGDQKISVTEFKVEEVDPHMLAEQDSADTHAEIESSLEDRLGKSSGRAAVNSHNGSEFNMVTAESVGLASEFISIEHLDKSNVFRCEVCGERCNTSDSLESHHSQLGHYKCYNASCGGVFCGTAQELATPQETAHADYTYEQNSGSVQQLVQQVLGLPTPPQENNQQNSLSQVSITSLPQVSIAPLPSGQVSISSISLPQLSFSPAQQQPHVPSIWLRPINSLVNPQPNSNQSSIIHLSHYENIGKESPGQSQSLKSLSNVSEDRNSVDDSTVPHRPAYSLPLDDNEEDGMDEVEGMLEDDGEKHEGVYATNEDGIDENDAGNGEDDGDAHMDEDEGIDDEELSEHKSPNEEDQNINESKSSVYHSASPRSPSQSDVNDCADDRNDDNRPQQSTSEFMFAPINETSQHTKFSLLDKNDPAGDQKISVTEFKVEEVDPHMLAEQDSADTHAEIESSLEDRLGKSSGRAAVNSHNGSEFNVVTAESVGLASEFISIEHLDKSNVFRCEVCGERCNTSDSLESHHSQLGHYKCYNASCGGVFCGTAQELATPQETAHADYTNEQNSGSVQQLVQQVLGLPTPPQENSQQNSLSQVSITSLPQVSISPLPSGQVSISSISLPQLSFSPAQQQPHVPSIWLRPINSLMNPQPNSNQSSIIHLSHYENIGKESPGQSQSPKSLSNVSEDRNSVDDSTVPHRPAYSLPLDDNEEYAEEDGMDEVEGMLEDDGEKHEGVYATNEDGIDENGAGNGEDDGDAHMDEDEGIDDEELSEHKSPNEEDQNINESKSSVYHSASPRSPSQSDVNDCADDRNDDNRPQQSTSEFMFAPINETSQHTKFSLHDENDPAGDQKISVTEFKVEEVDPHMLAEQDSADTHAEIESSLEDRLGKSSGRAAVNSHNGSEFNMVTAESVGLASEFISIEHLDKKNVFRCEVCGERCNTSDSLESHHSQLGHYKCYNASCGSVFCGTAQELAAPQETAHADYTYEQNSGSVQQLVQQVLGLPTPPQENNQQNSLSQVSITSLPQVSIAPLPSGQVSISSISLPQVSFSPAQQQPHVPSIWLRPINSLMNPQPNSNQSSIIHLSHYENIGKESPGQSQSLKSLSNVSEDRNSVDDRTVPHRPAYSLPLDDNEEDGMDEVEGMLEDDGEKHEGVYATNEDGIDENDAGNGEDDGDAHMDEDEGIDDEELSEHKSPNEEDQNINESKSSVYHSASPRSPSQSDVNDCADDRNDDNRPQQSTSEFMFAPINETSQHTKFSLLDKNDPAGDQKISVTEFKVEEVDPHMLAEQDSADTHAEIESSLEDRLGKSSGRAAVNSHNGSEFNVVTAESVGLASEFISIEHLDKSNVFRCEVCGERCNTSDSLESHHSQLGHYKCYNASCGGVFCGTAQELATPQETAHADYTNEQNSGPVQQLVQQVLGLPTPPQENSQQNSLSQVSITSLPQVSISPLPSGQVSISSISLPQLSFSPAQQQPHVPSIWLRPINSLMNPQPNSNQSSIIHLSHYENIGKESPGQSQSPKSLSNVSEDRNSVDDSTVPHRPAYSLPLDDNEEYAEEDGMDEVEGMLEDDGEKHEGVYATNEDGIDENGAGNGEDDGDAHMDEDEGIDDEELSEHKSPNEEDQNINESKPSVYHTASPRLSSQSDVNDCADDRNDDNRPQQSTSEFMFAPINETSQHTKFSLHDENDPAGDQKISVTEFKVEEVDPHMLAEQDSADTHAEIESSLEDMLGKSSGRAAVNSHNGSEFNMVTAESVGLASEFISIEHLDKSNVFRCEVCGERCNTSYSLESHRSQFWHYKCNNASCGGVFCGTAQELATHKETGHADYTYEQNSGSVQQLVQQVLGLPIPPQENNQQNSLSQVSITSLPQVSISPLPSGQVSISSISPPQVSFSPAQQQPHVPSIWLRPINSLMNPQPNSNQSSIIHLSHYENIGKESPGQSQSPKSLSNVSEDRNSVDDRTVPHRPAYSLPLDDNEEYAEEDGMDEVEGMLEDDDEKHEGVYATNEDGIDENGAGNGEDDGDAHMDEDEGIDDEELSEHKSPNEEDQNINESKSSVYHSASPRLSSQSDVNDCADDRNDDNRPQQSTSEFMFAPINDNLQHTYYSWHDENDPGGDQKISVTEFKVEEVDPLMQAEQDSADTHAEIESSLEDRLGKSSGRAAVNSHNGSEFNMVTAESVGLASEFISIEHLDKSNVFRCEVCGERCNTSYSLESHRSQFWHYKCNNASCGGVFCGTAQELATHKETAHDDSTYEQNSGSVQQLVQQVLGLPTPPQENNQQNSLSQVSITSLPQVSISPLPSGQVSISPISLSQVSFSPAQQQPHLPSIWAGPINLLMKQQPNSKQSSIIHLPQRVTIQPQGSTQGNSQKRCITTPPPVNHATKQPRLMEAFLSNQDDDPDCKVISVTKNVTPSSRHSQNAQMNNVPPKGRSDAKAVENILVTRGITVTPSGTTGSNKVAPLNMQKQTPITQLNLNSVISIMPTTDRSNNLSGYFAVPQGRGLVQRQHHQQIDQPMRPTIVLTKDTPMQPQPQLYLAIERARGYGPTMPVRHTCHLCDKAFTMAESLSQHLLLHRSPIKLAYRCANISGNFQHQEFTKKLEDMCGESIF